MQTWSFSGSQRGWPGASSGPFQAPGPYYLEGATGPRTLLPLCVAPYTGSRIIPRVQTEAGQQPSTPEYGEPSYASSSVFNPKPKLTWKEDTYLF